MLSLSLSILLDDDDDDQLIIMCSSSRVVLVILIHSNHHDSCVCVFVVFFVCMYSWKKVNTIHTLSLSLSLSLCMEYGHDIIFSIQRERGTFFPTVLGTTLCCWCIKILLFTQIFSVCFCCCFITESV